MWNAFKVFGQRVHRIKSLTVVTLKAKGEKPEIENYPLHPLRDVRKEKKNTG